MMQNMSHNGNTGFSEFDSKKTNELMLRQLHLFSSTNNLGNSLADWDLIPRFIHDKNQKTVSYETIQKEGHRVIELASGAKNIIHPAQITTPSKNSDYKGGDLKYVYPGTREALIEECLIDFAKNGEFTTDRGDPGYRVDAGVIGVYFTLYQLRHALTERGKQYKLEELKEGLDVLMRSTYSFLPTGDAEQAEQEGHYIISKKTSIKNTCRTDKVRSDRIMHIEFDAGASKRILMGHYRTYDAKCSMSMKSPISRHLYKHFTHHWQQANNKGQTGSYQEIMQNETILASGVPLSSNVTKRKTLMLKAMNELYQSGIIQEFDEHRDMAPIKHGKKIVDVIFVVRPTSILIKQQIHGFKRMQETKRIGLFIRDQSSSSPLTLDHNMQ
jgi:hypothetical protein